jgi:hypothetical protein
MLAMVCLRACSSEATRSREVATTSALKLSGPPDRGQCYVVTTMPLDSVVIRLAVEV